MAFAYVLVSTVSKRENEVYDKIIKLENVVEAHALFGEYDLIVKVKKDESDFNELGNYIEENIRNVDGIVDTKTLTGIKI